MKENSNHNSTSEQAKKPRKILAFLGFSNLDPLIKMYGDAESVNKVTKPLLSVNTEKLLSSQSLGKRQISVTN